LRPAFRRSALVTVCALFAALLAAPAASARTAPAPAAPAASARVMITAGTHLASAARQRAAPARYTVRPGDTLSQIAQRNCGSAAAYRSLAAASGFRNPDRIYPGQAVVLACHRAVLAGSPRGPPAAGDRDRWDGQHHACGDGDGDGFDMPCRFLAGHPAPAALPAAHYRCGDGDGDGFDMPCWKIDGRPAHPAPAAPAQPAASYSGGSGFQACVIARESGGNASAVNASSGAGGLYGFLPSTWAALGHSGLPENASVAEQNAAFAQQYAQSGTAAWSAYDGC
jgi:hypothetical protein